jgi:signal transduction histidine kinase
MAFRVTAAFLAAATLAGAGAMALAYGLRDGLLIGLLLVLMGLPVLTVSHLIARHRRRLGRLSWQLVFGVVVVLGLDLVGIQLVATLFLSPRDAFALALMLAFACVLVGFTAWCLIKDITRDIADVRNAVAAVRVGSRQQEVEHADGGDDELSALANEFNGMTSELRQREVERDTAERARRDLVAAVSHDLRTPVNALTLVVRAIEDDVADEQTLRRYLGQMAVNLESLESLINDLFELARLEAGDVAWSFEDLSLDALIDETIEGMTPVADGSGVSLRSSIAEELPRVRANAEKIQRVLFNLIKNAVQHTPKGGRIGVVAAATADEVEVKVIDTGPGIAADELDRVFEPLWRSGGASAARSADGAGLGLPIARSIVEAHGGRVYIAESSSSGTQIGFTLPRVPPGAGTDKASTPGVSIRQG